jgi:type II secretory pathway predicted ATPase ExeA
LTLLIGEAGTGKTTLVQAVLGEIEGQTVECVLLSNPTLTRTEFYEFLAAGFGLPNGAATSKAQFLFELRRRLFAKREAGVFSGLVLDEAQSLPYELLEEVRLLSNIETPTEKLLNVVLAGQPELAARLNEANLRQLKQRISLRCELGPFTFQETGAYIAGRLRIAGGEPAKIFTREAVLAIHDASQGVPRTINVICDNALIGGFAAQEQPVTRALVDEVCRDFDLNRVPARAEELGKRGSEQMVAAAPAQSEDEPEAPAAMFGTHGRRRRFSFF